MKRLIKIIVIVASVTAVFSACSQEEKFQNQIIGEWVVWHDMYENKFSPEINYIDKNKGDVYIFCANGNFSINGRVYSYLIDDDMLLLKGDGAFKIEELTSSDLKIKRESVNEIYSIELKSIE